MNEVYELKDGGGGGGHRNLQELVLPNVEVRTITLGRKQNKVSWDGHMTTSCRDSEEDGSGDSYLVDADNNDKD